MYHLEERCLSTAIRPKNFAEVFVVNVNRSSIWYAFATLRKTLRYNVNMALTVENKFSEWFSRQIRIGLDIL